MINSDTAPTPPDPHAQTEDRMKNFCRRKISGEYADANRKQIASYKSIEILGSDCPTAAVVVG